MVIFWTVFLVGILVMISSMLFYFVINTTINPGVSEAEANENKE